MSRLFLSCVTGEFVSHRTLLTKYLLRAKVDLRVQEQFGVGGGTLLQSLDAYIRECDAVIHLIGQSAGAYPEAPAVRALLAKYPNMTAKLPALADALSQAEPPISYTQWEAYLALYHDRDIHVYLPAVDAPRELSQQAHFQRIVALGQHRGTFENEESLTSSVLADIRHILPPPPEPFKAEPSTLWKLQTKPDAVFEGREKVLADLDALWADVLADKAGRAQIISLVAIGGAGKTTVASRWKDALLARDSHGGVERYFDWSFYSQGTRREGDNATAQTAADATVFIVAALKFFGDPVMADSTAPAWDKGARLSTLVAKHRALLILDGLEPLQHSPGPQTGELRDDAIRALLAGLQSSGRGLCIVTTREPITDLADGRDNVTPEWRLDHLTNAAGALILKRHGVIGPEAELRLASAEVKGHALTLSLMGRYLTLAFDPPDISRRDNFHFSEADTKTRNGHAFRVFAAYERWFEREGRDVELGILRLLGLFDRPATPDCLAALCVEPVIPGLTEPLVGVGEKHWNMAVQRLRELDLIETIEWVPVKVVGYGEDAALIAMEGGRQSAGLPQMFEPDASSLVIHTSIDAHPLLREYFDTHLEQHGIARAAHRRIYDHLCASVPYWPEGRDGLLPLYQAVAHGCKAGCFEEVCLRVYLLRIQRGTSGPYAGYSTFKLGLLGLDLAALACFFVEPWQKVAADLQLSSRAWLLNEAAFTLRAVNRLSEARQPMRAAMESAAQMKNWNNAGRAAGTLSEVELTLGHVAAAEATAAQGVVFASQSDDAFVQLVSRAFHAEALHQAGRDKESGVLFAEAEAIQAKSQPRYPLLYSLRGYLYCDYLLAEAERPAWRHQAVDDAAEGSPDLADREMDSGFGGLLAIERRAAQILEWANQVRAALVDVAFANLALGRARLYLALRKSKTRAPKEELLQAREGLDAALGTLREAGQEQYLPYALLPCAWLQALLGEWDSARQRLDESFAIATRGGRAQKGWQGGMRLHLIDTFLHRARLFGRHAEYPWPGRTPKIDLAEAATLIDACGYHRRDEELADAMSVFG